MMKPGIHSFQTCRQEVFLVPYQRAEHGYTTSIVQKNISHSTNCKATRQTESRGDKISNLIRRPCDTRVILLPSTKYGYKAISMKDTSWAPAGDDEQVRLCLVLRVLRSRPSLRSCGPLSDSRENGEMLHSDACNNQMRETYGY